MDLITNRLEQLYSLETGKYWPVGPKTGQVLFDTCSQIKAQKILELGTSTGVSSLFMLRWLAGIQGKLITVESNFDRYHIALETFQLTKMKKHVLPIFDHAPECFEYLNLENLDMVFTDCIKKQTLEMFQLLMPCLRPGGVFLVDNVLSHPEAMQPFIEHLKANQITYELLEIESGLIRVYKEAI